MRLFRVGDGYARSLRFTPDGRQLVFLAAEEPWSDTADCARWVDVRTGEEVRRVVLPPGIAEEGEDFDRDALDLGASLLSPGGTWVGTYEYFGDDFCTLQLGNSRTNELRSVNPTAPDCSFIHAAAFSPDDRCLAVASGTFGGGTKFLEFRDPDSGRPMAPAVPCFEGGWLAFSTDGRLVSVACVGTVRVFATHFPDKPPELIAQHKFPLARSVGAAALFRPGANELAMRLEDGSLCLWDFTRPEPEAVPVEADQVHDMNFSPDGRFLALAAHEGVVYFLDALARQVTGVFDWGIGPVSSVAFAPDGMTCAAGGENGQVVVWDVAD